MKLVERAQEMDEKEAHSAGERGLMLGEVEVVQQGRPKVEEEGVPRASSWYGSMQCVRPGPQLMAELRMEEAAVLAVQAQLGVEVEVPLG